MDSLLEGGSLHPKTCRCAMSTGHNPIALLQSFENLLTLRFLQNLMKCPVCRGFRSGGSFFRTSGLGKLHIRKIQVECGTRRNNHSALDYILQFSDVPGPTISAERVHRRGWNRVNFSVHAPGELLCKMPDQKRDVLLALAQWRHLDRKHIQTKEQI